MENTQRFLSPHDVWIICICIALKYLLVSKFIIPFNILHAISRNALSDIYDGAFFQAIKNYMHKDCKCHGLSGACSMKTCLRKMPHFREVGDRLKQRFDGAAKVIPGNDGKSFIPEGATIKPPSRTDLVYSEQSSSFCNPNNTLGSFGTQGRICNESSPGEDGCGILCCARGFQSYSKVEQVDCRCVFNYCCNVKCDVCNATIRYSICQ